MLAHSGFRLGLAYIKLGDVRAASDAIEQTIASYPVSLHGKAAVVFRNAAGLTQVGVNSDLSTACRAVAEFARQNLERFEEVWYYGYANPEFRPEALCPF